MKTEERVFPHPFLGSTVSRQETIAAISPLRAIVRVAVRAAEGGSEIDSAAIDITTPAFQTARNKAEALLCSDLERQRRAAVDLIALEVLKGGINL